MKLYIYRALYSITSLLNEVFRLIKELVMYKKYFTEMNNEGKNDIYISTFMKSGTTWMQMILYQLTTKGDMNFKHIYDVVPYIDTYVPFNDKFETKSDMRIFKTHLYYNVFPRKFDGKFICVLRDGMDVSVSQYHHYKDLEKPNITFPESFDELFANGYLNWFSYLKGWLRNKRGYKILYIKYEELQNNFKETLVKIADFIDLEIDEKEFDRIVERSSFSFMKEHEDKFGEPRPQINYNNFIRKGKSDEGSKYFTEEILTCYKDKFAKELSDFELLKDYDPNRKLVSV